MTNSTINPTPDNVADLAQADEKLALDTLSLIGLRVTPAGNRALVRLKDGTIATVSEGDTADGNRILAVTDTSLQIVDRRGAARTLTMPG